MGSPGAEKSSEVPRESSVGKRQDSCHAPGRMSITLDLPPEIEAEARSIPDLPEQVSVFIRHQVELDRWRRSRYSPQARAIVRAAMEEAATLQASGVSREQIFEELLSADLSKP